MSKLILTATVLALIISQTMGEGKSGTAPKKTAMQCCSTYCPRKYPDVNYRVKCMTP